MRVIHIIVIIDFNIIIASAVCALRVIDADPETVAA